MGSISEEKLILIVDDHPMVADSMRALLLKMDRTLKITICNNTKTALLEFHKSTNWFRIFLDVDVPGAYGLSLIRQFAQLGVADKCALITAFDNAQWRAEAVSMGMLGYIVKSARVEEFVSSLQAILNGGLAFPKTESPDKPVAVRLTRRQQDILCLLYRGYTSKKIAAQLGLTTGTVHNHVFALLNALGVKNRVQVVAKAIELGYIDFQYIPQPKKNQP